MLNIIYIENVFMENFPNYTLKVSPTIILNIAKHFPLGIKNG